MESNTVRKSSISSSKRILTAEGNILSIILVYCLLQLGSFYLMKCLIYEQCCFPFIVRGLAGIIAFLVCCPNTFLEWVGTFTVMEWSLGLTWAWFGKFAGWWLWSTWWVVDSLTRMMFYFLIFAAFNIMHQFFHLF
jgi:hypothetical protein